MEAFCPSCPHPYSLLKSVGSLRQSVVLLLDVEAWHGHEHEARHHGQEDLLDGARDLSAPEASEVDIERDHGHRRGE